MGSKLEDINTLRMLVHDTYKILINNMLTENSNNLTTSKEKDGERQWSVDLCEPLTSFDLSDPNQRKQCFNYKNTRPIWNDEQKTYENLYGV